MSAILAADFESGLGITGAATPYLDASDLPLFKAGDTVYKRTDLPATISAVSNIPNTKYTIVWNCLKISGSPAEVLDQRLAFATPADPDTLPVTGVSGWDHLVVPGTPGTTSTASTKSSPWFYVIQNAAGAFEIGVHESAITDATGYETFVAAQIATLIG